MKPFLFLVLTIVGYALIGQNTATIETTIPDCQIKTLDGTPVNTTDFDNGDDPFIILFWQSCCNSNLKFMESLYDIYDDLFEESNLKVFAISVDDSRSSDKVKSFVNGKGWDFEFYLDPNGDFKRLMNVNLTPHYLVYDGKKKVIMQKTGFFEGDQFQIQEVLSKFVDAKIDKNPSNMH